MLTIIFSFSEFAIAVLLVVISVQQTLLHRIYSGKSQKLKAESPHETLHTEDPYKQLPFLDFSPAATNFRCIWPYTTKRRKCTGHLNQKGTDRYWANTLRNTIADDSPYSERVQAMLGEYAEFCLCWKHRPRTTNDPEVDDSARRNWEAIIEGWVRQWLVEIKALHDSLCEEVGGDNGALGESVLLFPQATVPEPASEDESPNVEDSTTRNTPLKRETSDPLTPIKTVPGSFPGDDDLNNFDRSARRSSTPGTSTRISYSQTIRNSPHGVRRLSFRRTSSAAAQLGSKQTAKFEPYPPELKKTVLNVLNTPLGTDESKSGYLYIFTRRSAEGSHSLYVKIGMTRNVANRLKDWKTQCGYEPHLEYKTARVRNAMRVELLVHTELSEDRYIQQHCSGCGGNHDEWFKTDVDTARPVIKRWARWMQESDPYSQKGQFSTHVVKEIFEQ